MSYRLDLRAIGRAAYWGAGINDGNTDPTSPMVAMPQYHDNGSKTLLPDYKNGNGSAPYVAPRVSPSADLSQRSITFSIIPTSDRSSASN